jgi:hypothetical protein
LLIDYLSLNFLHFLFGGLVVDKQNTKQIRGYCFIIKVYNWLQLLSTILSNKLLSIHVKIVISLILINKDKVLDK